MCVNIFLNIILTTILFGCIKCDLKLLLLHNNDMHVRFEPTNAESGKCADTTNYTSCYGGFARVHKAVVDFKEQAVKNNRSAIFINAGDTFQGTPYFTYYKWKVVADIIDFMDIDVMSLGNHEFDNGVQELTPYLNNISTPVVSCNLNLTDEPDLAATKLKNSIILNVSGVQIGVIGYLTPETKDLSQTGNVIFLDEIESITAEAQKLKAQGVNIIIALGHSGYDVDQQIAKSVADVDIVVGGHSHSFLYTGTPPDSDVPVGPYPTIVTQESGRTVPVVQAYAYTKYLGYLEVDFDDDGEILSYQGSPVLLNSSFPEDPVILQRLQPWKEGIYHFSVQSIGTTKVLLDQTSCKLGECNIGNLITDAFVDYNAQQYQGTDGWTDAAIGLIQAGGIRSSIDASESNGTITMESMLTVMPFNDTVMKLQITGSVLLDALEWAVHRFENTTTGHVGEFLHFSGVRVAYDLTKPSYQQRVVSARVRCGLCSVPSYETLNETATYGIIIPDYVVKGGDGFKMFTGISKVTLGDTDADIVIKYITDKSPIYPGIESRITFMSGEATSPTSASSTTAPSSAYLNKHSSLLLIVPLITFYVRNHYLQ